MLLAAVLVVTMMTSCERDNEVKAVVAPDEEKNDSLPTPSDEDYVAQTLSAIPGISNVTKQRGEYVDYEGYYFKVEQLVDNSDPSKGTFNQLCFLSVADRNAPVMLYTNGYNLSTSVDSIGVHDIAQYLNANSLYVEHRYFGESLPEDFNNLDFTYFNAQQAAADLHRVVTLMKQYIFNKGNKWVSTGTSKCGINTTLYAYYSDLYGWDDIDLYMPFCAPFLTGTPQSAGDKTPGVYLHEVCGNNYPAGSPQAEAYQYLCAYPSAIANNKVLRDACLSYYHQKETYNYLRLLKDYPNDIEKAATVGVLDVFYENLFTKFSYIDFNAWCTMVPDPTAFSTTGQDNLQALYNVVDFIFLSGDSLQARIDRQNTNAGGAVASVGRRSGFTVDEIRNLRRRDQAMPYDIQAVRELGSRLPDYSLLPADGFVTSDYCDYIVQNSLSLVANYGAYAKQWDGGELMRNVREWVNHTQKHLVFVYGSNDPWTGGAIDSSNPWMDGVLSVNPANANVSKVLVLGGTHNHYFLNSKSYPVEASSAIKQALDKYVSGK